MARRLRIAEIVAFIGLLAAFVGALGPAREAQSTYSWPPRILPTGTPDRLWYTPLLLAHRLPERVSATIPCRVPPTLGDSAAPSLILSTARFPRSAGGLEVRREGEVLLVRVGDRMLTRARALAGTTAAVDCRHRLEFAANRWWLEDGIAKRTRGGSLDQMPVVNGLFSGVDLRSRSHPSIQVTTQPHRALTTTRQALAWILALVCALTALFLVTIQRRPSLRLARVREAARSIADSAHPVDSAIGLLLAVWWIGAPAFFDDGWTIARQTAFRTSGGFSNYYESFGANLPLGYWLEWSQHWLTQSTNALILLRIPTLVALAASWVACRWVLARLVPRPTGPVALWTLAVGFAVMVMAWGMTLRQEPVVALLVAGVMACCVHFLRSQTSGPLTLAAILVPLAVSAHPTGIVAFAPLIAILPLLLRWAREQPAAAVALFTASGAILLSLAFVGSDVQQRARDAQTLNEVSTTVVDWRDELRRYSVLADTEANELTGYATPLRRASVALLLLAVVAFVARRRRSARAPLDLPAITVGIALLLLVATPSKWPWHFGGLIAFGAVACATEAVRLRNDASQATRWQLRPFVAIGLTMVAVAWSWFPRGRWNALDLRTLDWTLGLESWLPLSKLALVLPLVLLGIGVAASTRRGGRAHEIPWRVAAWSTPIVAVPLIAFTVVVLAVDAARTVSWTLPRQNLEALRGNDACGIAADFVVPSYPSMRPLPLLDPDASRSAPEWLPAAPVPGLPRFALSPSSRQASASPWFRTGVGHAFGLFVTGQPTPTEHLELEWGFVADRRVTRVRLDPVPLRSASERGAVVPWRFVPRGELRRPPHSATAARLILSSDAPSGTAIGVTPPVTYANETLAARFSGRRTAELVQPNLLPFTPCARLPRLAGGTVEVPATIVSTRDRPTPFHYVASSPFSGLLDVYSLEQLPLADSSNPPSDVVVFGVNRSIPGGLVARADKQDVAM